MRLSASRARRSRTPNSAGSLHASTAVAIADFALKPGSVARTFSCSWSIIRGARAACERLCTSVSGSSIRSETQCPSPDRFQQIRAARSSLPASAFDRACDGWTMHRFSVIRLDCCHSPVCFGQPDPAAWIVGDSPLNKPQLPGSGNGLVACGGAQLPVDRHGLGLDGVRRQEHLSADLRERQVGGEHRQDA
jgi:hypothetical protein